VHHHPGNRVKFRKFSTEAPTPAACGQINTKSDEEGQTRGYEIPACIFDLEHWPVCLRSQIALQARVIAQVVRRHLLVPCEIG